MRSDPTHIGDTTPSGVSVNGKFLEVDGRRFLVKGASYGTFVPDASGQQFPEISQIEKDFAQMAAAGVNTVRTYTPPTNALLDSAARHGLHVMAGWSWPQHVPVSMTRESRAESGGTPPARCGACPRTRRCYCFPSGTKFQAASSGGTDNAASSGSWASYVGTSRQRRRRASSHT